MSNKDIVVTFEDENEIVIKLESKTFLNLQKKTVAPSTEEQVVRSDSGYEGLKEVTVEAVTSSIDNNIVSGNIKKNVTILGVEGTFDTPEYEGSYEITSNGTYATSGKKMTQDLVVNTAGDIIYGLKARCEYTMESLNDVNGIITEVVDSAFVVWNTWSDTKKKALKTIYLPNATTIGQEAFKRNTGLTTVTLLKCTSINTDAFANCTRLATITLGASSVCSIASTSTIYATSSHHITIYVPSNLVESYKTATNWSTLYNNGYIDILAITE